MLSSEVVRVGMLLSKGCIITGILLFVYGLKRRVSRKSVLSARSGCRLP